MLYRGSVASVPIQYHLWRMSAPAKLYTKTSKRRVQWPRVRYLEGSGRPKPWLCDARINGKGERYFFETATEADTKADQLRINRKNSGDDGATMPARLRIEATDCAQRLAAVGATISEATEFFLRHARCAADAQTIEKIIARFLREKEKAGRRPEYLRVQGHVLGNFKKQFAGREVHTIAAAEIVAWMDEQPWTLRTRENYRRDLSNLFGFAMKHGYCAANPLAKMERATLDDKAPGIVSTKEASALLNASTKIKDGALLPYVAIGLFAGLRTSELHSLEWQQVSIDDRTIEVQSHKAKGRARRIVTMSENLCAWLKPRARADGAVVPRAGFRGMWREVRKAAALEFWQKNALRHSFASYHVALNQNAPATSLEMGHDNPDQLFKSYRSLVRPQDAVSYWKLVPPGSAS